LRDHLDPESALHFATLRHLLDALGIPYVEDSRLVRGLDYYNRTVFEWVTDALGAQGTVLAGGRYDGLVEQLGGSPTPAMGFAVGLERLLALQALQQGPVLPQRPDLFLGVLEEAALAGTLQLAERLRGQRVRVVTGGPAGFKALMKQAERSRARFQALLGDAQLGGAPVLLKEQGADAQWQGPLADLALGLSGLGVDFRAPGPHT
jgi:histidyl-tRNA synthetase